MFNESLNTLTINTEALHLTEDEFFNFCQQNRDLRMERDSSKNIIFMAPTAGETGRQNFSLYLFIGNWNLKHKSGYAFDSSTGFTLPNGAMRSPDVAWIKKEKWEKLSLEEKEKFSPICPDFIIELKSKSDSLKELKNKMQEWIANGCRLAWLIDIENKNVFIYRQNGTIEFVDSFSQKISGEDVLSGFELDLNELK